MELSNTLDVCGSLVAVAALATAAADFALMPRRLPYFVSSALRASDLFASVASELERISTPSPNARYV